MPLKRIPGMSSFGTAPFVSRISLATKKPALVLAFLIIASSR
jgi:hypothetical protein